MELALQIAVALFCLPLTALGLRSMVKPIGMGTALAIEPHGSAGLNLAPASRRSWAKAVPVWPTR